MVLLDVKVIKTLENVIEGPINILCKVAYTAKMYGLMGWGGVVRLQVKLGQAWHQSRVGVSSSCKA